MATIDELREQEQDLAKRHRAAAEQAERVRAKLDPSGRVHIRAEMGEKEAQQTRRSLRSDLAQLDRKALDLEAQLKRARYALSSAEAQHQEAERELAVQERQAERDQVRRAAEFTAHLERELAAHLGDLGWYLQPNGPVRDELEGRALAYIRQEHGEGAAEFAREHLLPRLGGDSSTYSGPAGAGAPMSGPRWRVPGDQGAA